MTEKDSDEIFLPPPPETLTRFYGTLDYAIDLLRNHEIALVHASKMNDPFDPYFEFLNDFGDRYGAILNWIRDHRGDREVRQFKRAFPYSSWDVAVRGIREKNNVLRSSVFLFCASAPMDGYRPSQNLYMWGHYGSGHRGVAIEFNSTSVAASVRRHQIAINSQFKAEIRPWTPVLYKERLEKISAGDFYEFIMSTERTVHTTQLVRQLNTISRVKSPVWKPEQEWRLLWRNDEIEPNIYCIPIEPSAIKTIFIGLRIEERTAEEIANVARANFPDASVVQCRARPGEFALDFNPIFSNRPLA